MYLKLEAKNYYYYYYRLRISEFVDNISDYKVLIKLMILELFDKANEV